MKTKTFLTFSLILITLSAKLFSQSITIAGATSSNSSSCNGTTYATLAYVSKAGCQPGWCGSIPMVSSDWITFDLGNIYSVSQITYTISYGPFNYGLAFSIQSSTDGTNYSNATSASITMTANSNSFTINANCMGRYFKFTNFAFQATPVFPIYLSNVSFSGSLPTSYNNISVTGNLWSNNISTTGDQITLNTANGYLTFAGSTSTLSAYGGTGILKFSNDLSFGNCNDGRNRPDGITWYSPAPLTYGIYRTSGAWTAPNYQQLKLSWATGIVIDGGSAYGQSGTVLQPNGGNVGIGTSKPLQKLDVNGGGRFTGVSTATSGLGVEIDYNGAADNRGRIFTFNRNIYAYGGLRIDGSDVLINASSKGNVCIGTTTANGMLHINAVNQTGLVIDNTSSGYSYATLVNTNNNTCKALSIQNTSTGTGVETFYLYGNGDLHTTGNAEVSGTVYATKVIVEASSSFPDYVFSNNYKLKTLAETEAYIKANNHLEGVPSATEVKDKGIDVGEMNTILLKKIEEMTLLMIEQEKRINELESKVGSK